MVGWVSQPVRPFSAFKPVGGTTWESRPVVVRGQSVAETAWNLDPPPGFRGLNPDEPITLYVRHLPHWQQDGATYFVTFRLKDSLPQSRLRQLRALKREWEERNPPPRSHQALEEISRETMRRVERWLDQGMGSCALKPPDASREAAGALHHFAGERYELGCFVVHAEPRACDRAAPRARHVAAGAHSA